MNKKRRILAVLLAVLTLTLGTGLTMAYLADGDTKTNPFSIAVNTIVPEEEFETPVPGQKTVKSPRAVNTGTTDCYVRGKVLLTDSRAEEYISYYTHLNEGMNTGSWTVAADGWMYHEQAVRPGGKTEPVFTHIQLSSRIPDEIRDVAIDVVFESVQSHGSDSAQEAFKAIEGNR